MLEDEQVADIIAIFDAHEENYVICQWCDGYGIPAPVYQRGRYHQTTLPCEECDGTGWIKKAVQ